MLHRSLDDGAETEMANLLEWAEERELIDGRVHRTLMKEFSRRIEKKTRRRRTGGVLQNLTRRRATGTPPSTLVPLHGMSQVASQPNLISRSTPSLQTPASSQVGQTTTQPMLWPSGISF